MTRTLLTRDEFDAVRRKAASDMAADRDLQETARRLILDADRHLWIHQPNWFGEPMLQLPQDMFAIQELVFGSRPRFIVELGVAWGGSLLFYATLMAALAGDAVIGVDVNVPDHVRRTMMGFEGLSKHVTLIEGNSTDPNVVRQVRDRVGPARDVLVILDSFHTHAHVLQELRLYSGLVGAGHYLICCDTHVETIPEIVANRPRPWGAGNNPKTAVDAFLAENERFEIDRAIEQKYLLTLHPGGYLRCHTD